MRGDLRDEPGRVGGGPAQEGEDADDAGAQLVGDVQAAFELLDVRPDGRGVVDDGSRSSTRAQFCDGLPLRR